MVVASHTHPADPATDVADRALNEVVIHWSTHRIFRRQREPNAALDNIRNRLLPDFRESQPHYLDKKSPARPQLIRTLLRIGRNR